MSEKICLQCMLSKTRQEHSASISISRTCVKSVKLPWLAKHNSLLFYYSFFSLRLLLLCCFLVLISVYLCRAGDSCRWWRDVFRISDRPSRVIVNAEIQKRPEGSFISSGTMSFVEFSWKRTTWSHKTCFFTGVSCSAPCKKRRR